MKELKVRLTFTERVLGTAPANEEIYRDYIGTKAADASTVEDEVKALGVDGVVEKGMTIFPKSDGTPIFWDYQIKGFFKDTCGGLRKVTSSKSSKIKAYKKEIDKLIFPTPRSIKIDMHGMEMGVCQRPLRAQTAQGERVSLAISEMVPAGATCEFSIVCLCDDHVNVVREWLDYGVWSGIGQWRNASNGRFYWEELDEAGEVVGGNKPKGAKTA